MIVIFSTYQSIQVVHEAQEILERKGNGFTFDITICDEAHRTTGKTIGSEKVSHFNLVHDSEYIKSKRRLYMTATPRLYKENLQKEAKNHGIYLWSMDNEDQFGEEIFKVSFGEAVKKVCLQITKLSL